MRVITLGGFGFEEEEGHSLVAVILLSAIPDSAWIMFFRDRARHSVFDIAAATFRRNQVRISLPRREDLGALILATERCIETANRDTEFRSPSVG
jgi:hypothetical protein